MTVAGDDPDDDLFTRAMQGVRPVRKTSRIRPSASSSPAKPSPASAPAPFVPTSTAHTPQTGEAPWTLCASGVSRERLRRLAGEPADAEIDLHGHTRDEALRVLETAMLGVLAREQRTLCIVHGRGLHSQGRPVLKQAVFQWLREGPCAGFVLAAVPRVGSGGGASILLLRRRARR